MNLRCQLIREEDWWQLSSWSSLSKAQNCIRTFLITLSCFFLIFFKNTWLKFVVIINDVIFPFLWHRYNTFQYLRVKCHLCCIFILLGEPNIVELLPKHNSCESICHNPFLCFLEKIGLLWANHILYALGKTAF